MKIAAKAPLISLILVLISVIAVAIITYFQYDAFTARLQEDSLARLGETEAERLSVSMGELFNDIHWFGSLTEVMENDRGISEEVRLYAMTQFCRYLLESKPTYDQIRILGKAPEGQETLRVDRKNGEVVIVPETELQSKGGRDYYLEALRLAPDEIYFSAINLNRERGEVEVPYKPTLRAIVKLNTPTGNQGEMVVINQNFGDLLHSLFYERNPQFQYFLTNAAGDYLMNPDSARTFGFDLGEQFRIQDDYPETKAFFEREDAHFDLRLSSVSQADAVMLHLCRFYPFPSSPDRALVFGVLANNRDVAVGVHMIAIRSMIGILVMVLLTSMIAFALSGNLVRPILQITRTVASFRRGEKTSGTLPVKEKDEIGELARAFDEMLKDIEERKLRILKINNQLEIANADLRHFTRVSSHELREPVQRVRVLADLLNETSVWESVEERDALLNKLKDESATMLALITDFTEFTYLEESSLGYVSVDLMEMTEQVLKPYRSIIEQRHVEVNCDALPTVTADPQMMRTLYDRLVDNAFKSVSDSSFELKFTASLVDGAWELGVYNTGSTIEESYRESVFFPFIRLNKNSLGSGMGLAICKRIISRHGGRIWIEGDENSTHVKFVIH